MPERYRDADWLAEQYRDEGLTQREIAERCGVSPRTIRKYMRRFGIETRSIEGENHPLYGKERDEAVREKIAASLRGRRLSEETRRRMSKTRTGATLDPDVRKKISRSSTGIERSKETRRKMSRSTSGDRNPNWKGGYSRRYGSGWSLAREAVLQRDQVCQYRSHDGSERRLEVHHIVPVRLFRKSTDFELSDAHDPMNLVLLCRRCHGKADHDQIRFEPVSGFDHPQPD